MWLMKTLLTLVCTNQQRAGQSDCLRDRKAQFTITHLHIKECCCSALCPIVVTETYKAGIRYILIQTRLVNICKYLFESINYHSYDLVKTSFYALGQCVFRRK